MIFIFYSNLPFLEFLFVIIWPALIVPNKLIDKQNHLKVINAVELNLVPCLQSKIEIK